MLVYNTLCRLSAVLTDMDRFLFRLTDHIVDFIWGSGDAHTQLSPLLLHLVYLDMGACLVQLFDTVEDGFDKWPPALIYFDAEEFKRSI